MWLRGIEGVPFLGSLIQKGTADIDVWGLTPIDWVDGWKKIRDASNYFCHQIQNCQWDPQKRALHENFLDSWNPRSKGGNTSIRIPLQAPPSLILSLQPWVPSPHPLLPFLFVVFSFLVPLVPFGSWLPWALFGPLACVAFLHSRASWLFSSCPYIPSGFFLFFVLLLSFPVFSCSWSLHFDTFRLSPFSEWTLQCETIQCSDEEKLNLQAHSADPSFKGDPCLPSSSRLSQGYKAFGPNN